MTIETRGERRKRVRVEARQMLGLSRRQLATLCGWRGISRVENAENHGTPYLEQAEQLHGHLKAEAERQGKPFPYTFEIYF